MRDQRKGWARKVRLARRAGLTVLGLALAASAQAETIGGALTKAYLNNPDINSQRAAVRAADEYLPQANAGYLPSVTGNATAGVTRTWNTLSQNALGVSGSDALTTLPNSYGVNLRQNIFDGNKTFNTVRAAESGVLVQRETLRYVEEGTLLNAVTYYMNVMRDTATLDLNRSNVEVLKEQLRQTRDRFNVGEVTRTDVAQAEAALAQAQSQYLQAQSVLQASIASYRQVIGDPPSNLAPVSPVTRLLPSTLPQAVAIAAVENPQITLELHNVDVALLKVKISEAALYPQLYVTAGVNRQYEPQGFGTGSSVATMQILGNLSVPIYDGGASYAGIRQAKETVTQQELKTDSKRDVVRQAVVASWGQNQNAVGVLRAARAQVQAAEVALAGVREEAKVGQRTTLDVLNAQQTLLQARTALVNAQRDQVVYSYQLLNAIGRLTLRNLGISVAEYDPRTHFDLVKTKQFGVRTPDGR